MSLTLYVQNVPRDTLNATTVYIIPPRWHDTGSWNSSPYKASTYLVYIINIMGADILDTQGARISAAMILTMVNHNNSVPLIKGY